MAYKKGDGLLTFGPAFLPSVVLFQICLFAARLIDWFVFGLTIKGRENLRTADAALLVSNHTLVVDPGVVAHVVRPRRTYYSMLEETALIPFLGTFVRLLGGFPIPLSSFSELEAAVIKGLDSGGFVHFFPEGECYLWNQEIRPFYTGAFYLACRLMVPVIPITTVLRERRVFGRSSFAVFRWVVRVPPHVTVVVGRPLSPEAFLAPSRGTDPTANREASKEPKKSLRRASRLMSETVRAQMQEAIDRERGSKTIYRGKMPRIVPQRLQ